MTIIAYKDGQCWSDDLLFAGDLIVGRERKIVYRKKDGAIGAASGASSACSQFLKWAETGRGKPPAVFTGENSLSSAIIITSDGYVNDYTGPVPSVIGAECMAIGSGSEIATGAMMAGASALDAVIATCRAFGWPAYLIGVNHAGEWSEFDTRTLPETAHHDFTPKLPTPLNGRRT